MSTRTLNLLPLACALLSLPACATPSPADTAKVGADADVDDGPTLGPTTLSGSVRGHQGQALSLAHVHVARVGREAIEVEVDSEGRFELELEGSGFIQLQATGADHLRAFFTLPLDGGPHALTIALGTHDRPDSYAEREALTGFGYFQGWDPESDEGPAGAADPDNAKAQDGAKGPQRGARVEFRFEPQPDGTWRARLDAGEADAGATEFRYQLADLTQTGRTMNGTLSQRFLYDGGGDYFSVVSAPADGAPLELTFDPSALPPPRSPSTLSVGDPKSEFALLAQLSATLEGWIEESMAGAMAAANADPDNASALYEAANAELLARLAAEIQGHTGALRRAALVIWADAVPFKAEHDEALLAELLSTLEPDDPMWSLRPEAMSRLIFHEALPAAYFTQATTRNGDIQVLAPLWYATLVQTDAAGEHQRAQEAYELLHSQPLAAHQRYAYLSSSYDPNRAIAPGKVMPELELTALDGGAPISTASLRGQTYVLDFWATWCGPCIAEMPRLHATFAALNGLSLPEDAGPEAYRDLDLDLDPATRRVQIIGVSFDEGADEIHAYRKDHWPMPWRHSLPTAEERAQLRDQLPIIGIPAMILVDPEGKILASGTGLRAESLASYF